MSDTLSITPGVNLTWDWVDTPGTDIGTISDTSSLEYSVAMASDSTTEKSDVMWRVRASLAATSYTVYDLTALAQDVYGETVTLTFANLKGIMLVNHSETTGEELVLMNSGTGVTAGHTAAFHASSTTSIQVPADSTFLVCSVKDGWACGTNKELKVYNPNAAAVTYTLALWGTTT